MEVAASDPISLCRASMKRETKTDPLSEMIRSRDTMVFPDIITIDSSYSF